MNLLYVTLTPGEKRNGLGILALFLLPLPFLSGSTAFPVFLPVLFPLTLWVFRRFLRESFQVPLVTPGQILFKASLAALISQLSTLLTNDLIYYFLPRYFQYTDFGPLFYRAAWETMVPLVREHPLPAFLCLAVLLPVIEELLYRGLIFHGLHSKSRMAAYAVSTLAFAAIHVVSYVGTLDWGLLGLSFVQYLPAGLSLAWAYEKSDTIWAPILMHITINQISITFMR